MRKLVLTTLACLAVAPPAFAQSLRERVNKAIDRGVEWLIDTQLVDGSWNENQPTYRAGQTALNLYALLECDVDADDPCVVRATNYLIAIEPVRTYEMAVTVNAFLELVKEVEDEELRELLLARLEKYVETLVDYQSPGGGYAYPTPEIDLSNTQYAAMALHNAALAGFDVPQKTWKGLAEYTLGVQDGKVSGSEPVAGFCYREDGTPTGSMTSAGVATLHICIEHASRGNSKWTRGLEAGMRWLAKNFVANENPGAGATWHYYYLYNVERLGAYLGIDTIGTVKWYETGAAWLVDEQQPKGDWWNQPNTAFALLFLKRATAPSTGQSKRAQDLAFGEDRPDVPVSLRAFGENPVRIWLSSFGSAEQEEFGVRRDDGTTGIDVVASEYWLRSGPGVDEPVLLANVEYEEGGDARLAFEHEFEGRGTYVVDAQVTIRSPHEEDGDVVLASGPLEIVVRKEDQTELVAFSHELRENLLLGQEVRVRTSSEADENHDAAKVADGIPSIGWVTADVDPEPFVSLAWNDYLRAGEVRLVHVQHANHDKSVLPRRVRVTLNGKDEYEVVMPDDRERFGRLVLDRTTKIRNLRIDVLDTWESDSTAVRPVGLGEVMIMPPERR
ncbi:MAG: hypothetical protein R3F34_14470 [Planctomycetota bacterium]